MKGHEEEYSKIVKSPPQKEYDTPENEAFQFEKFTILKEDDVHYGEIVYYNDKFSNHKNCSY